MNSNRWGIIGCGNVARKRVAAAIQHQKNSRLIAACRRNDAKLREFCATFNVDRAYSNHEALLADEQIDAVYISSPVCEHFPQTVAAAQAGKHVLVEKPMAMNVDECDQMIAACKSANVKLGVAYYRRFYPLVHRIDELLKLEAIGKPLSINAVTATATIPSTDAEGYWRIIPAIGGGGALMDIGSHRINIFLQLFGNVTEVKLMCESESTEQAERTALLLLRFENRAMGSLECHFGTGCNPDELSILGTNGRIFVPRLNGDQLVIFQNGESKTERHEPDNNLCAPLIADFNAAILEDREPMVSGAEGMATNRVIERAYASRSR